MGRPRKHEPKKAKSGKLYSGSPNSNGQLVPIENHKHAQPTAYDPAIAKSILDRIAAGETVEAITAQPGMPDRRTAYRWLQREEWQDEYQKALRSRAQVRVELAEEQANALNVETERDMAQIRELRIRNHIRLAALGDPMKYSDKMLHLHHHSGSLAVEVSFDFGTNSGKTIEHQAENPDESAG